MNKEIRILFTCVGRRIELLQAFREASVMRGTGVRLYGADADATAPALAWCDVTCSPCGIDDEDYAPQLLELCRSEGISLVVPTIDTDLMKLAEACTAFEAQGTRVLVSDPDMVELCRDKLLTSKLFESCGLKTPEVCDDWREYAGSYPCFVKPRCGSGSIDAYCVSGRDQLELLAGGIPDYIVQPFVEGRQYTVDVFCDYEGGFVSAVPRERVEVRAGEVSKTRIEMDRRIIEEAKVLAERVRPRGPMTIQLIRDDKTGEDWFIEINPRFGGGVPLSIRAGAKYAEWALDIAEGRSVGCFNPSAVADGALFSRYDQSVRMDVVSDLCHVRGVVFDLDDTLYPERDYVRSGFREVAQVLGEPEAEDELWSHFVEGAPAIDAYVEEHQWPERKEQLLDAYRTHMPQIELADSVREMLASLREHGLKLGIITDGRPEGQRAKLDALGLWDLVDDVIITDELGGPQFRKPCDIAFRILQRRWGLPFEQMAYVGDNPRKDFLAPRQLGMGCVQVDGDGLYAGGKYDVPAIKLAELVRLLRVED